MTEHEHEFANGRCGICAAVGYTPDELEQITRDIDVLSRAALTPMPKEEPVSTYLLWVNEDRTVLVRWWPDNSMEVCTRSEEGAIWGPPVKVEMEAVNA